MMNSLTKQARELLDVFKRGFGGQQCQDTAPSEVYVACGRGRCKCSQLVQEQAPEIISELCDQLDKQQDVIDECKSYLTLVPSRYEVHELLAKIKALEVSDEQTIQKETSSG